MDDRVGEGWKQGRAGDETAQSLGLVMLVVGAREVGTNTVVWRDGVGGNVRVLYIACSPSITYFSSTLCSWTCEWCECKWIICIDYMYTCTVRSSLYTRAASSDWETKDENT